MHIRSALAHYLLNTYQYSVISEKEIRSLIEDLYIKKEYLGERLNINKEYAENREISTQIQHLMDLKIISIGDVKNSEIDKYYKISGKPNYDPSEILCTIYNTSYISFLSAMSYYSISDKIPKTLYLSIPNRQNWREEFLKSNGYKSFRLIPSYPKLNLNTFEPVRVIFTTKRYGSINNCKKEYASPLRIVTIGKLFSDMIAYPDLCGGQDHVLDVLFDNAKKYHRHIINYVDSNGSKLDKARVGFFLEKVLSLENETLQSWRREIDGTHGGSSKFFAQSPHNGYYSFDWGLALNNERLKKYGQCS